MPFADRFKQGVDTAKFKADHMLRVNRVQTEITDVRREISGVHEKIANTVIQLYKQGALSQPELTELCDLVDQKEKMIAEKEALVTSIKAETMPANQPK